MRLSPFLLAALALLIISPAFGKDACPSNIRGQTIHWIVAVCEKRSETDDFEAPSVQKCLADTMSRDGLEKIDGHNCKLNARYKKEWCAPLGNPAPEAASRCFASPDSLPRVVREGGVGG